jgi:uncharacterized protein (TIGR03084 family)
MTSLALKDLLDDLAAESQVVEDLLLSLQATDWELPSAAAGWAIRDQVSHLAFFDEAAVAAATEPDRFRLEAAELLALGDGFPDEVARRHRHLLAEDLLGWFRSARVELLAVFTGLDAKARVPWFGPDMSVTSSVTARLMETWAHGQDIASTFGVEPVSTARLRHIAHLGVRTYGFGFALNDLAVPDEPIRVDLEAPDGSRWTWGEDTAANSVTGTALDFCLLVTQRRHLSDTDLVVSGPVASAWMSLAQAFAGAASSGREPRAPDVREVS